MTSYNNLLVFCVQEFNICFCFVFFVQHYIIYTTGINNKNVDPENLKIYTKNVTTFKYELTLTVET